MNILYLSCLEDKGHAGPTYSVPNQVAYQSKYDNVLWYNLLPVERKSWRETGQYYNQNDFQFSLNEIERRIGKLDLVVFEGFYAFHPGKTVFQVLRRRIPYCIVPRSAFTVGDQEKSKLKKQICNKLFYKRFARNALFIQYLSQKEKDESDGWNENSIIVPNGSRDIVESSLKDANRRLRFVYIGRIEPYQKGLDILLDALEIVRDRCCASFDFSFYGSSLNGSGDRFAAELEARQLGFASYHPPVFDAQKEEILQSADVFVLTSRYEGLPMGLLEAFAYGLPCLVTPGTNLSQEIYDYDAGWIASLDSDSIAEKMLSIIAASNETLAEKSKGAYKLARLFSWEEIAKRTHIYYGELIGK